MWLRLGLVISLMIAVLPLTVQAAFENEVILNENGAGPGELGLSIEYANGELQVFRDGTDVDDAGQFFDPGETSHLEPDGTLHNAIALNVGGDAHAPSNDFVLFVEGVDGFAYANTTNNGGSLVGSGTATGTLDTRVGLNPGVTVDVTIDYIHPNNYFTMTLVVNSPGGLGPVKLYHFVRSWLGTSSAGAGFFDTTGPDTVGVELNGRVEAFRYVSGPAWTGYFSGDYTYPYQEILVGNDFDDGVDTDPGTENGFGIMWDFGAAAGTYTVSYDVILTEVPDAPAAPVAFEGNNSATVTVTKPSPNGSEITGYTVTSDPDGLTCSITFPDTSCEVTGLTNDDPYTFTATATNANGTSPDSPASNSVTPDAVPDVMVAPIAAPGNATATVTITPPPDNGSLITLYTVTSDPGGLTCTITPLATACDVLGLTNGTPYTFTATATNGNGTNAASPPSNSVTPTAPGGGGGGGGGPAPIPEDPTGPVFTDIPAGEMADAASWLAGQGITLGCIGGESPQFCPFARATRAEVATFLSRALDLPPSSVNAFTDDDGHQLEDHLNRAFAGGVFLGCSPNRLVCPDDDITRAELATVLVRAFDLATPTPATFADVNQHWAQEFIGIMGGLRISIGCVADGTLFCPEGFATRGEIALFLYRTMNLE